MNGVNIPTLEVGNEVRKLNIVLRTTVSDLTKEYIINDENFLRQLCRDSESIVKHTDVTSCEYILDNRIVVGYIGTKEFCRYFGLYMESDNLSDLQLEIEVNGEIYKSTDFQAETFELLSENFGGLVKFSELGLPYMTKSVSDLTNDCKKCRVHRLVIPITSEKSAAIIYNIYNFDDGDVHYELAVQLQ